MDAVTWSCPGCGEELEAQFDKCWSCGTSRSDSTPHSSETATTSDKSPFQIDSEDSPGDDKIAAFKQGKRVTASSTRIRSTWTVSTVIIVGLILISAATVGAIIRDAVHLEMLEIKQESQIKQMKDALRRPGR